ncbi:MAG: hypothetical protein HP477_10140 [Nitrospira sp.]|nr:hypothetical protein [Nitrospira sp.]
MKRFRLVWALLVCLVLTNGFMAAPSVVHAEHHGAHHDAGTHASGICAWLCAAGQDIDTSSVEPTSNLQLVQYAVVACFDEVQASIALSTFPRGPPLPVK